PSLASVGAMPFARRRHSMSLRAIVPLLACLASTAAAIDVPFAPRVDLSVAPHPAAIAAADFDRDGRADCVTVHPETDGLWVLLSRRSGDPAIMGPLQAGVSPCAVDAADMNHDTRPDIVVANAIGNTVSV